MKMRYLNNKNMTFFGLLIGLSVLFSCSNKDFPVETTNTVPGNFHIQVNVVGASSANPNGDGSGVVTFNMSATKATYYKVLIPTDNQTLTLNTPEGGNISYTFSSNPGKTISYSVLVSAFNKSGGHVDTTLFVSVYFAIPKTQVRFWKTYPAGNILFAQQYVGLNFGPSNSATTIVVDSTQTFQSIDGFGFALTGGSANLINGLSETNKANILKELFTTDSTYIGISYLRLSIGASDLSSTTFSYDDIPGDSTLQNFSIDIEKKDLIPILKQIVSLNPAIKIIATPWSAPAWMKTNNNTSQGSLKPECYKIYANYFVKYIQAMQVAGIPIDAVTPQNEPLNAYNNPAMLMQSNEENDFIKNYLAPQFNSNGIKTKIIVYDHNLDHPEYATLILSDNTTYNLVDGSAFHLYAGDINTMSSVHNAYPNKNLYFTEQFTSSDGDFAGDMKWHIQNLIIGATRNWSKNVLEWNLASDPNMGPHTSGGCSSCLGAITISGQSVIKRNQSYYIIAHAAKFVRPGAIRIGSTSLSNLPNVAFKNTDGTKVLIVLNVSSVSQTFNISFNNQFVPVTLESGSVGTFSW
ncbi:MAG: glycoside hydrolase family 30 beta sandwich domain-containing protein [Paludibacter sp.]|nr:glycoside hydrolase family 30 beta sandwich domain-containing protein [Paludibacter sp.]